MTAAQYIRTGMAKHVLVIGADAMSRLVDWRDRGAQQQHSVFATNLFMKMARPAHMRISIQAAADTASQGRLVSLKSAQSASQLCSSKEGDSHHGTVLQLAEEGVGAKAAPGWQQPPCVTCQLVCAVVLPPGSGIM